MAERLLGRTALVTGAAQGIGAAIARAMARQGAMVWVTDRNEAGAPVVAQEFGGSSLALDVAAPAEWEKAAMPYVMRDMFWTSSSTMPASNSLSHSPIPATANGDMCCPVNLHGACHGCRALLPLLLARPWGSGLASVINISSIAGLVGYADQVAYNVSKAGLRHLSKSLAIEWAAHGYPIRVNSILPGCIRTPLLELAVAEQVRSGSLPADGAWEAVAALAPLHEVGDVEDIAMGAVYLASAEAKFVTGTELVIDGGWTAR